MTVIHHYAKNNMTVCGLLRLPHASDIRHPAGPNHDVDCRRCDVALAATRVLTKLNPAQRDQLLDCCEDNGAGGAVDPEIVDVMTKQERELLRDGSRDDPFYLSEAAAQLIPLRLRYLGGPETDRVTSVE